MLYSGKSIGIWGYGIVGKSAAHYFHTQGIPTAVFDNRSIAPAEQEHLKTLGSSWFGERNLHDFLQAFDTILPSPGIDLRPYAHYSHKWLAELDLFQQAFSRPIIAITGSIGKTTITHILSHLLKAHGLNVATGGNIGTGMLDLVANPADIALLEVSSFQLELCKQFAPTLAIWTNFHPNHLDRHTTLADYFYAKYAVVKQQTAQHTALLPFSLTQHQEFALPPSRCAFFIAEPPTHHQLHYCDHHAAALYYVTPTHFIHYADGLHTPIFTIADLPAQSFVENWLIICSALHLLNVPLSRITQEKETMCLPEHRLEKVASWHAIDFYNDSKSTTPASTLAAVEKLHTKPIHLLLGGMSKGIDRAPLIKGLKNRVKQIYCFGKEAEMLHAFCMHEGITSSSAPTLEEAFAGCIKQTCAGEQIVLSPAGASFDLFQNYAERGKKFKELVQNLPR